MADHECPTLFAAGSEPAESFESLVILKLEPAASWESSLSGAHSDRLPKRRKVPALLCDKRSPRARSYVRFDGVDPNDPKTLIDRKWGVTTKSGQVRQFKNGPLRALGQNPDYRLRIEVPNKKAEADAYRLLFKSARVKKHPQIEIVIVEFK